VRGLGKGTAWLTASQAGRLLLQSATFVLVARALGATGFGAFAASLALVSVASPFGALGAGNLLVMHLARRPESFARQWGAVLLTVPIAGVPLMLIVLGAGEALLPVPLMLVLLVAVAELFFARLAELSGQAFQGLERARAVALLSLVPAFFRLGAAIAFTTMAGGRSPVVWAAGYLVASAAAAVVTLAVVTRLLGAPRFETSALASTVREGGWFALAQSSANIYTDIDKTLLARLGSLQAAGVYAVAYRATAMAFTPIAGLLSATYARFFKRGESGIHGSRRFAVELLPAAALYGLGAGVALYAIAPVLPHVLGGDYANAVGTLRWLAPLPLVQALYYLAGDALTGAGYQRTRTAIQVAAAGINILLCLWLIPAHSWRGAAWATLVSLGLLAAALWTAVGLIAIRKEGTAHADARARLAGVQP
jgi:O-antigen/teichoic acid export membrane protein